MSVVTVYSEGSLAGASATFTDANNALADPTEVTAQVLRPDGTLLPVTTVHQSTGIYTIAFVVDQPGRWTYGFNGTGTVTAALEGVLDVTPSSFDAPSNPILTVRQLQTLMVQTFTPQQWTAASVIIDGQIADVAQFLGRPLETETIIGERVPFIDPYLWASAEERPQTLEVRRAPILSIEQVRFADGEVLDPRWYVLRPWGFEFYGLWWPAFQSSWFADYSVFVDYTAGLFESQPAALAAVQTAVRRAAQREMTLELSGMRGLRGLSVDGGTHYVRDTATRLEDPGAGLNDGEKALISKFKRKWLG